MVRSTLEANPDIEIVDTVSNGKLAVETVLDMNTKFVRLPDRQEAYSKVDARGQSIQLAS